MTNKTSLFRVTFTYLEAIYEIYAAKIHESDMFGFIIIEDIVFGENTAIVVDPSEERLKAEFNGVKKIHIPMNAILRIDEVTKRGTAKVRDKLSSETKVALFPTPNKPKE